MKTNIKTLLLFDQYFIGIILIFNSLILPKNLVPEKNGTEMNNIIFSKINDEDCYQVEGHLLSANEAYEIAKNEITDGVFYHFDDEIMVIYTESYIDFNMVELHQKCFSQLKFELVMHSCKEKLSINKREFKRIFNQINKNNNLENKQK